MTPVFNPQPTAPPQKMSPREMLYAVERRLENAEYHLLMAVEELLLAKEAHAIAAADNASQLCPDFYRRVQDRLTRVNGLMQFRDKMGV